MTGKLNEHVLIRYDILWTRKRPLDHPHGNLIHQSKKTFPNGYKPSVQNDIHGIKTQLQAPTISTLRTKWLNDSYGINKSASRVKLVQIAKAVHQTRRGGHE